jgi:hypothetical protein
LWRGRATPFVVKDWMEDEVVVYDHAALSTHLLTRSSFSVLKILMNSPVPLSVHELAAHFGDGAAPDGLEEILDHVLVELGKLHLVESVPG